MCRHHGGLAASSQPALTLWGLGAEPRCPVLSLAWLSCWEETSSLAYSLFAQDFPGFI